MKDDKAREEARKYFKQRMGSRVTEMPDGMLTGAVDPEVAIDWVTRCFCHLSFVQYREYEREYKPFDQLSLKELEELVDRLNKIIANIKGGGGRSG